MFIGAPASAPPSTTNSAPVQYEAASDARKATSSATSSGRPIRDEPGADDPRVVHEHVEVDEPGGVAEALGHGSRRLVEGEGAHRPGAAIRSPKRSLDTPHQPGRGTPSGHWPSSHTSEATYSCSRHPSGVRTSVES